MKHLTALVLTSLLAVGVAQGQLVSGDGLDASNADLGLWLRADMGVTDDSGVTEWVDQSTNGFVFSVADTAAKPTVMASSALANGQTTIQFHSEITGTIDRWGAASNGPGTALTCDSAGVVQGNVTIFHVISMTPPVVPQELTDAGAHGAASPVWAHTYIADDGSGIVDRKQFSMDGRYEDGKSRYPLSYLSRNRPDFGGDATAKFGPKNVDPSTNPEPNYLTGEMAILRLVSDVAGQEIKWWFNGDDTDSTPAGRADDDATVEPVWLGSNVDNSSGFNGEFAEMIIYNRMLTEQETAEVEQYLAARYGIGTASPPLTGDANDNGLVDDDDLSLLLASWGQDVGWENGNFNGDNTVDDDDLSLLLANWTGSGAVPEPLTGAVLALGALGLLRRRRR